MVTLRARVELRQGLTHHGNGRFFRRGESQIITNLADVRYYQREGSFTVTLLEDKSAVRPSVPEPTPNEPAPPVFTQEEIEDSGDDYTRSDLAQMKKADLVEICEEWGLPQDGTIRELTERILAAQ